MFDPQVTAGFSYCNSVGSKDHLGGHWSAVGSLCQNLLLTEGKAVAGSLFLSRPPSGLRKDSLSRLGEEKQQYPPGDGGKTLTKGAQPPLAARATHHRLFLKWRLALPRLGLARVAWRWGGGSGACAVAVVTRAGRGCLSPSGGAAPRRPGRACAVRQLRRRQARGEGAVSPRGAAGAGSGRAGAAAPLRPPPLPTAPGSVFDPRVQPVAGGGRRDSPVSYTQLFSSRSPPQDGDRAGEAPLLSAL